MTIFGREFEIERLSDGVLKENGWLCDLLHHWHPSGDAIGGHGDQEGKEHLRLAIRNGYLNFYRAGQSVAKVGFDQRENLQAKIHNKYVYGKRGTGQSYVTLTAAGFRKEPGGEPVSYDGADLREWISNANERVGDEKRFVDLVVARNPDVIDLEIALPAYSLDPKERKAPRMDLVALELSDDRWHVVFWEAKLVDDARARCRGDDVCPKVVDQLAKYTRWLRHANHRELVASAYQNALRLLVAFHGLAKRVNPGIEALGPSIVAAAASGAPPLLVDVQPRLLIYDRARDNGARNVAFTQNGHLKKLRDEPCGIHVQMVSGLGDMALETRA
jgi:hypothetical protein